MTLDPAVSMRSRTELAHWPDEIWSDYPSAYVRLTTLRAGGVAHLLFGCVELLPRETAPIPGYKAPRLSLPRGASAMSSLTVMTTEAALTWYEDALSGVVAVPGMVGPPSFRAVRLAPEPRLGGLVVSRTPTVPVGLTSGPRMHRMVPMEGLPEAVNAALSPSPRDRPLLRDWMLQHCFIDLAAHPDCAGGLVLLAANPIIRRVSEYPLRKLPDGREVLGVTLVPRSGSSLGTVTVRLSETRPDGFAFAREVALDALGEAELILPQEARDTALEVSCSRRGLLHAAPHTASMRSIGFEIKPMRSSISVEVPARTKSGRRSRYVVPLEDPRLAVAGHVGTPAEFGAAARLEMLLAARSKPIGRSAEQVVFRDDRGSAVKFVHGLVMHASSRLLFVDPYFGLEDLREFALTAWSASCVVSVLTSAGVGWTGKVQHFATDGTRGDLMAVDLEHINHLRSGNGMTSVGVGIMGSPYIHDRFLVVDDAVWHFGDSFGSLGRAVSMASRVRDAPSLLPILLEAAAGAEPFGEYWIKAKAKGPAA